MNAHIENVFCTASLRFRLAKKGCPTIGRLHARRYYRAGQLKRQEPEVAIAREKCVINCIWQMLRQIV
jgi:hypothetical protein